MKHELTIEKEYLANLLSNKKKVEIRFNDRDYQTGDILEFWANETTYQFKITHVHSGLGLKEGYVALSVENFLPGKKNNFIPSTSGKEEDGQPTDS